MARAVLLALKVLTQPAVLLALLGALLLAGGLWAAHDAGRRAGEATVREEITRPGTGWAVRLATCQASNGTLAAGLKAQNDALQAQSDADAARLKDGAAQVEKALSGLAASDRRIAALLKPVEGPDQCARTIAATQRVREVFK